MPGPAPTGARYPHLQTLGRQQARGGDFVASLPEHCVKARPRRTLCTSCVTWQRVQRDGAPVGCSKARNLLRMLLRAPSSCAWAHCACLVGPLTPAGDGRRARDGGCQPCRHCAAAGVVVRGPFPLLSPPAAGRQGGVTQVLSLPSQLTTTQVARACAGFQPAREPDSPPRATECRIETQRKHLAHCTRPPRSTCVEHAIASLACF